MEIMLWQLLAQNVSYQYYDGHRMKIELLTGDKHASANDVYPSSDNTVEAKIRYSYVRKYTYGELMHLSGDWMAGCMSASAKTFKLT